MQDNQNNDVRNLHEKDQAVVSHESPAPTALLPKTEKEGKRCIQVTSDMGITLERDQSQPASGLPRGHDSYLHPKQVSFSEMEERPRRTEGGSSGIQKQKGRVFDPDVE